MVCYIIRNIKMFKSTPSMQRETYVGTEYNQRQERLNPLPLCRGRRGMAGDTP